MTDNDDLALPPLNQMLDEFESGRIPKSHIWKTLISGLYGNYDLVKDIRLWYSVIQAEAENSKTINIRVNDKYNQINIWQQQVNQQKSQTASYVESCQQSEQQIKGYADAVAVSEHNVRNSENTVSESVHIIEIAVASVTGKQQAIENISATIENNKNTVSQLTRQAQTAADNVAFAIIDIDGKATTVANTEKIVKDSEQKTEQWANQAHRDAEKIRETIGDSVIPEQTGNAGKLLGTNGDAVHWEDPPKIPDIPDPLPAQSNNSGKFLSTDGNHPQWQQLPDPPEPLPEQNNNGGKFLSTNGSQAQWQKIHDLLPPLPDQEGYDNKVLITDGTTSIWKDVSAIGAIPVGIVILFCNSGTLPDKWLECKGQSFNAVLYPKLSKLLGKNTLPNFSEVENQRYIIKADDSPNIEVDEPTRVTADTIAAKVQAINYELLDFGTITYNSRYVKPNPFGKSPVLLSIESYTERSKWFYPGWQRRYGMRSGHCDNNIVVQTGTSAVISSYPKNSGGSFDVGNTSIKTARCRVHVWQVGV
ncbi:hypothetical protein CI610_01381 [invertebrate metagenome]|uniref:Phage tail collar domain-containing protein n=1 Tax=invertebrate metagenome TaxID=1711999 RepID=A0A2H9T8Z3_9ZZZZ